MILQYKQYRNISTLHYYLLLQGTLLRPRPEWGLVDQRLASPRRGLWRMLSWVSWTYGGEHRAQVHTNSGRRSEPGGPGTQRTTGWTSRTLSGQGTVTSLHPGSQRSSTLPSGTWRSRPSSTWPGLTTWLRSAMLIEVFDAGRLAVILSDHAIAKITLF